MKKPALLRAAIAAHLPHLARDPDKLAMWTDRGNCRAVQTRNRGFAWEYELTVVAEDYKHDPALIFFIVVDWLRTQQPDLLAPNTPGFTFEVDVLDDKTFDVKIVLSLREIVTATAVEGGWQLEVVPERDPQFPDAVPLRAAEGPISSIWVTGTPDPFEVAPDPEG